jgi:hypothetical protein
MTFTPWMPILQVGAAGPVAPYAIWVAPFTDYSPTGWQKCQWRFDPATGDVEYRGLAKTTGAISASNFKAIDCFMAVTPMLPKPTKHFMSIGQTSFTPALARNGAGLRWDLRIPTATEHHNITVEMAGTAGVPTGSWFWLDSRTWSLAPPAVAAPVAVITNPTGTWSASSPVGPWSAAASTGNITSYDWDFDEGYTGRCTNKISSLAVPLNPTYSAAGSRIVKLTVTGPGGSSIARYTVNVTP